MTEPTKKDFERLAMFQMVCDRIVCLGEACAEFLESAPAGNDKEARVALMKILDHSRALNAMCEITADRGLANP